MQKKASKSVPVSKAKPEPRAYQKSSMLDKAVKGFLVRAKLAKDGKETDTQTSGGDKQSDD